MSFLQVRRKDVVALVVVVVGSGSLYGYAQYDIHSKRSALESLVATHQEEILGASDTSEVTVLTEALSGKSLGLFGRDWGVIRIHTRAKDDASMETYGGTEYFYRYEEGEWRMDNSARIDLPEHIYEGYAFFEDEGYEVDDEAYMRYNR